VPQSSGTYQKNFVIDDKPITRFTLVHTVPTVLFEPNHLLLLSGPPELRRDFLDGLLEQSVTGFAHLRKQYRRALSQRNALLKQGVRSGANLFAWNIRLSELGGRLALQRQELVTSMNEHISELYRQLSHTESHVELAYKSSCAAESYSSSLLHKLEAGQALDLARGFTGHGPHRDDLVISLNGHPAEETASRGETRTLLLALKILELQQLERLRETKPLLLLDDVFSELDGARRKALTEALAGYQTFITTTDADVVIQHFMDNCNIIALEP
jgi:DNA replication and repair protein RecF